MNRQHTYQIRTFSKTDATLLNQWMDLWQKSPYANYINGPQWYRAISESFESKEYRIFAAFLKDDLIAILAVTTERVYGIPVYTLSPGDFVEGNPFLVRDSEHVDALHVILERCISERTVIFDNIPDQIASILSSLDYVESIKQTLNYYLPIRRDPSGQIVVHGRKKLIKEAKYIQHRYHMRSFSGRDPKALEIVFALDEKSRKLSRGYNTFSDKTIRNMYRRLAQHFADTFRISILYFDQTPVAYEIGYLVKQIYTGSQVAFDETYAKYTPGKVSELMVIDTIAGFGVTCIDYGSGDSYIKRLIAQDSRILYKIIASKKRYIRYYMHMLISLRTSAFSRLSHHIRLYRIFKKLKHIFLSILP